MKEDFLPPQINADDAKLYQAAVRFRTVIEQMAAEMFPCASFQNFPGGICGDAALLLAKYLEDQGHGKFDYVLGEREGYSHAWLDSGGLIVDITADQFDDQKAVVLVTRDHTWHSGFNGKSDVSCPADYELYDAATALEYREKYRLVIQALS